MLSSLINRVMMTDTRGFECLRRLGERDLHTTLEQRRLELVRYAAVHHRAVSVSLDVRRKPLHNAPAGLAESCARRQGTEAVEMQKGPLGNRRVKKIHESMSHAYRILEVCGHVNHVERLGVAL